jgi:branched-chain amino acid transport system permease protein
MTAVTPGAGPGTRPSLGRPEIGRLAGGAALGLLAAVITGPSGNGDKPLLGIRGALLHPRVVPYLVAGIVLGALFLLRDRGQLSSGGVGRQLASARGALSASPYAKYVGYAVAALLVLVYPAFLSPFWQGVAVEQIAIYVLLALGLNIVVGLAGLLDLGYIAFFAIGAYTSAYFTGSLPVKPPFELNAFFVIPIAILVSMLAGVILGGPTLRLRGDYLAIVTLGFGEIVRILAVNGDNIAGHNITDGPRGAAIPSLRFHVGPVDYTWGLDSLPYYYLVVGFIVVVVIGFKRLEDSRVGRSWTAIREDEVAAAATGVPTVRYKLLAFAIGASTSGLSGVLYASKVGFFAPDNFLLVASLLVLTMVIFGGMGSIPGVILGAFVLQWLPNVLRDYVDPADRFIYFGALIIVMMIFRPQGIVPSKRRAREIRMSEAGIGGADALGTTPGAKQ